MVIPWATILLVMKYFGVAFIGALGHYVYNKSSNSSNAPK
jgi:hypothetical protein